MNDSQLIEQTLIRYALACDRRDWALLEQVFTQEVAANYGSEYRLQGRDRLIGMIKGLLGGWPHPAPARKFPYHHQGRQCRLRLLCARSPRRAWR